MDQLIHNLQRDARRMFESDEFARQRQTMIEELQKKQQEMMQGLMEEASRNGFSLRMAPSGVMLLPTKDGKPMQEADYLALSPAEKKSLEEQARRDRGKGRGHAPRGKKARAGNNRKIGDG